MRQIGTLAEGHLADRFVDYLFTEGVSARADQDNDGQWSIWVMQENDVQKARDALEQFRVAPDDQRYQSVAAEADRLRNEERKKFDEARKNIRHARDTWQSGVGPSAKRQPVTLALIVICVGITLWTGFGESREADLLGWVSRKHLREPGWDSQNPQSVMTDILSGEIWRLFTPMFLHLNVFHLVFNMYWMHTLGGQLEGRKGRLKYILIILALAAFSGLIQAIVARQPFFGGMSGVVYGVFGYIWMKTRFDPKDGFYISQGTVNIMIIWFIVCFLPYFAVANGAHAGGLILGVIMGYVSSISRQ